MALKSDTIHLVFIFLIFYGPTIVIMNFLYYYVIVKPNREHPVFRIRHSHYLGLCLAILTINMTLITLISYLCINSVIEIFYYQLISETMMAIGSSIVIIVRLWILWFDVKLNRIEQERLLSQFLNKTQLVISSHSYNSSNENENDSDNEKENNCNNISNFVIRNVKIFGNSMKISFVFVILVLLFYTSLIIVYITTQNKSITRNLLHFLNICSILFNVIINIFIYQMDKNSFDCLNGIIGNFVLRFKRVPSDQMTNDNNDDDDEKSNNNNNNNNNNNSNNNTNNKSNNNNNNDNDKEGNDLMSQFRDDYNIRIELTITTCLVVLSYIACLIIKRNGQDWKTTVTWLAIESCIFHSIISGLFCFIPFHTINQINANRIQFSSSSDNRPQNKLKSKSRSRSRSRSNGKKVSLRKILSHNRGFYLFVDQLVQVGSLVFLICCCSFYCFAPFLLFTNKILT